MHKIDKVQNHTNLSPSVNSVGCFPLHLAISRLTAFSDAPYYVQGVLHIKMSVCVSMHVKTLYRIRLLAENENIFKNLLYKKYFKF